MWYNQDIENAVRGISLPNGTSIRTYASMSTDYTPEKRCNKCQEFYPPTPEYFHRDPKCKDGLRSTCKNCVRIKSHEYYLDNTETIKANVSQWQRENYDKWYGYAKKSRHDNPVPSRQRVRKYQKANPEKLRAQQAVKYAVKTGKLPHTKELQCKHCDRQAQQYHHWSYLPEHWLDVIPLCAKCHRAIHITQTWDTEVIE